MRFVFLQTCFVLPVLAMGIGKASRCARADEGPSMMATAELFDRDVLADNVFAIRQAVARLPALDRYELLQSHVLPGRSHREFRLFGKLTPTDPPDSAISEHPIDVARIRAGNQRSQRRIHTGGIFLSPVFDLIHAAKETGKLDDLRVAVQAVESQEEVQRRCQLSLLAMIAIAKSDLTEAARSTDELYQRFVKQRFDRLQDRMPETLLLVMAAEQGVLLDEALLFLVSIQDSQIRAGKSHGPTEWDVLMIHLIGRLQHHKLPQDQQTQPWTAAPHSKTWHWVTRTHSWSSGRGMPSGHPQAQKGVIDFLAKMDDEFLLFTSPMRGNYTLECLCTCFGWKEIHPLINGGWITPVWHHESVQAGELLRVNPEITLQPKLSRVDNWLRFRVDVQEGVCSRYLNSRLISRTVLPKEHDPWVAIRNPGSGVGSVRDVRITGEPIVPEEVRVSELRSRAWQTADKLKDAANEAPTLTLTQRPISDLPGWISWHEDPWTPEKQLWKLEEDSSSVTQIVGLHRPELSGTGAERMLRYVWPLVWNSDVSYEFFYKAGKSIVHPSLGRRAFLIDRGAVQMHDTTNGVWENSGLDPLNQAAPGSHVEMESLPLKSGEWNRMVVQINGDVLRLLLNDVWIHQSTIAATNDRSFGLFYYCDQTEARVRNIVLKGDWPKSVPSVVEQELRGTETDTLDREREALAESLEFDFSRMTETERKTTFADYVEGQSSNALFPGGLQMSGAAAGPRGNADSITQPRIGISGDFDVIAEFADLRLKVSENGSAAIYMGPRLTQGQFQMPMLYRGIIQHPDTPLREVTQVEIIKSGKSGRSFQYPASYSDECRSGRLRVARRGKMFHYLIAPLDSDSFRLLHSVEISDTPILPGNFVLRISCYSLGVEPSEVSVAWKKLSVRADAIENPRTWTGRNLYLLDLRKVGAVEKDETKTGGAVEPIRQLAAADEHYTQMKWPTWSHDGKSIIYEMNNGQFSVLRRTAIENAGTLSLTIGTLPSFSPDGTEIVITNNGMGVSIIPAIGGNVIKKALDPDGISGTWSPDGRSIAWISNRRIVVHDVKTEQRRMIPADDQPSPFLAIEKGLGWSRDSKSLAFKARLVNDQGDAVAIVAIDLDKPDKVNVLYTGVRLHSDVSWHPEGNQVLFSGLDPSTGTPQMFIVRRNNPEKIVPVPGQPRNWRIIDCDWSPDGHQIVFTAEPPP